MSRPCMTRLDYKTKPARSEKKPRQSRGLARRGFPLSAVNEYPVLWSHGRGPLKAKNDRRRGAITVDVVTTPGSRSRRRLRLTMSEVLFKQHAYLCQQPFH